MPNETEISLAPMSLSTQTYKGLLIGIYMLCCVYTQKLFQYYNRLVSDGLINLTYALIIVTLCHVIPQNVFVFTHIHPRFYLTLLQPLHIVSAALNIEIHLFLKCLPMALLISTIGMGAFAVFFGYTIQTLMRLEFNWLFIIGYGVCMASTDDSPILGKVLKAADTLNLSMALLTSETMITITHSLLFIKIVMGLADGCVNKWYHVACIYVRSIGGGLVFGLICGNITGVIMGRILNNFELMLAVLIGISYLVYYICESLLYCSGTLATFVVSLYISREKSRLSLHAERRLKIFLELVHYALIAYINLEVLGYIVKDSIDIFNLQYLLSYFAAYFVIVLARFLSLLVLYPLLFKHRLFNASLFVIMFFTRRGMIQLLFIIMLYHNRSTHEMMHHTTSQVVAIIYLQLLVYNIGLKRVMYGFGLDTSSYTKRANLANCVKLITELRRSFLTMMKMDKYLGDANWDAIEKATVIEELLKDLNQDFNRRNVRLRTGVPACRECEESSRHLLVKRETIEEVNDIRIRILQSQKVSFIRQKEKGQMYKSSLKFLLYAIDVALESNNLRIKVDDLLYMLRKRNALDYVKTFIIALNESKLKLQKPRSHWRRIIFFIVMNRIYDVCMYFVVLSSLVIFYVSLLHFHEYTVISLLIPYIIFFIDIILRMIVYWHIKFIAGFKKYISDPWNIFDVFMFMINTIEICVIAIYVYSNLKLNIFGRIVMLTFVQFRNLRILKLIHVVVEARGIFLKICNHYIGKRLLIGYGVAQSLMVSYNEVLHILPMIVESKYLRNELEMEIVAEKAKILMELCKIQLHMNYVAVTAKTKRVLSSCLNTMTDTVETLKLFGFADEHEYYGLLEQVEALKKPVMSMAMLKLNSEEQLFYNQPFFENNRETDFLFKKSILVNYKSNDLMVKMGECTAGMYIIVEGLAVINYHIESDILGRMIGYGAIPIKEYIAERDFHKTNIQNLIAGNCMGVISLLTKRASDCEVRALVPCRAYFIPEKYIHNIIQNSDDSVNGLYSRLWKYVSANLALTIMWNISMYQNLTVHELYYYMEKSFVPNVTGFDQVFLCDAIEDIILIEGRVQDVYTKTLYTAPCYLPRSVRKILFIRKKLVPIEPQLFIVPIKEDSRATIFELMDSSKPKETSHTSNMVIMNRESTWIQYSPKKAHVRRKTQE